MEEIRKKIDSVDEKLAALFKERMELSKEIALLKKESGKPVLNSMREREVLSHVSEAAGEELEVYARQLYLTMFDVSRSYQSKFIGSKSPLMDEIERAFSETPELFPNKAVVACQGTEGAYSQLAAEKLFGLPRILYFKTFDAVFNAVEKGLCEYGILPIENSTYGSVGPVYDLMKTHNFHIARAYKLRIAHRLLAKPGTELSDIREIVSHSQALGQCSAFLSSLKDVKLTECENTAVAAETVANSERNDIAAISSAECAGLYGLSVLKDGIQMSDNNYTRFICISKNLQIFPGANKLSLMLSLPHRPLSLYNLLGMFASLGLNLTKLESRPVPGSDFEFMFYFDVEASLKTKEVATLLCELDSRPEQFVFLGNYMEN